MMPSYPTSKTRMQATMKMIRWLCVCIAMPDLRCRGVEFSWECFGCQSRIAWHWGNGFWRASSGFYFYEKDGNFDLMLDSMGGCAQKEVGEKPMSVGAHGYQVALFFLHPFDDF